ncbi:MAG: motility protein A [Clostridiales bacterium]|nr:motility protein A [Clostridiales bacterium]
MSKSTILSIVLAIACVVASIMMSGELSSFYDPASIFIVVGGVVFVTVASSSPDRLKNVLKAIKIAFRNQKIDLAGDIDVIVEIANNARRNGLLALEELEISNPYLKKGIMLVVDGSDQVVMRSILETEIAVTKQRHADNRAVLDAAAGYSPAFGMIGTLIGLINMLLNLDDMSSLGPNMSVALVTTFYGSCLANIVFSPLSKRLKALGTVQYMRMELMLEGIMAIQNGENPRAIREKLNAFISNTDLNKLETKTKEPETDKT